MMSTWTPRKLRLVNKSGDKGGDKKIAKRRAKLANQRWCNASYNLTQREHKRYSAWCASIDSSLGMRRV